MHSPVQWVVFCLSDTMRSETSPASLLTEVCSEVCVEPDLQSVTPDQLYGASANSQDGARLDVSANGVRGGRFQKTLFDVRVFNPLAPSNRNQAPAAVYRKHELEKKRAYQQRAYKRWNIPPSSPLFFQPQEVWVRSHHLLQAPAWHRCSPRNGTSIQHDPMLATVPPELLPPSLIHPSNQRCQILSGTRSEVTNGN